MITTTADPGAAAVPTVPTVPEVPTGAAVPEVPTAAAAPYVPAKPPGSRLEMTGQAFVCIVLFGPTVALFCIITVGIPLVLVGVGGVLLAVFVPLNHALANLHRSLAEHTLGTRIEDPYLRSPGGGPIRRLRHWSRDPARWRDYGWLLVSMTIGFVLSVLVVGLFLAIGWYLVFPYVFAVTPDGVFDINYGVFTIDTVRESFYQWVLAFVAAAIWWRVTPPLMGLRARIDRSLLAPSRGTLERRVEQVAQSRAQSIDYSAAELRRIERDLHDGAQARLVSLGMNLGMAEELLATDPQAAARLLEEARLATTTALGDLRSVVRGIHPPVLADRGLPGAVQALALDMAIPISVTVAFKGRPPAPVESAAYFAIAECMANIAKHSGATRGAVELAHDGTRMRITVQDTGHGGADAANGTGLSGVERRLGAFDGTMEVVSPTGGPTTITMEIPCALSLPKTSPS